MNKTLAIKTDGFTSLLDALEYAARGDTGYNFYNHHCELESVLSYTQSSCRSATCRRRRLPCGRASG